MVEAAEFAAWEGLDPGQQKRQFYIELKRHCLDKGYRPGWTACTYKERFGAWPPPGAETLAPADRVSPIVRTWMEERNKRHFGDRKQAERMRIPAPPTVSPPPRVGRDAPVTWRDYLLSELRTLAARLRGDVCDVDTIGIALRGGFIDNDEAMSWLGEMGYTDMLGVNRIAHRNLKGDGHGRPEISPIAGEVPGADSPEPS
jgi:hypothetical protein